MGLQPDRRGQRADQYTLVNSHEQDRMNFGRGRVRVYQGQKSTVNLRSPGPTTPMLPPMAPHGDESLHVTLSPPCELICIVWGYASEPSLLIKYVYTPIERQTQPRIKHSCAPRASPNTYVCVYRVVEVKLELCPDAALPVEGTPALQLVVDVALPLQQPCHVPVSDRAERRQ